MQAGEQLQTCFSFPECPSTFNGPPCVCFLCDGEGQKGGAPKGPFPRDNAITSYSLLSPDGRDWSSGWIQADRMRWQPKSPLYVVLHPSLLSWWIIIACLFPHSMSLHCEEAQTWSIIIPPPPFLLLRHRLFKNNPTTTRPTPYIPPPPPLFNHARWWWWLLMLFIRLFFSFFLLLLWYSAELIPSIPPLEQSSVTRGDDHQRNDDSVHVNIRIPGSITRRERKKIRSGKLDPLQADNDLAVWIYIKHLKGYRHAFSLLLLVWYWLMLDLQTLSLFACMPCASIFFYQG